ncbi:hypothetical protein [Nonomuraea sp. NPDC049725]|uniref:hypothetical protein n=1 Tax=Nonomuraea sp. NPDC049725 TaxID=3154508 RepID=UPI0034367808
MKERTGHHRATTARPSLFVRTGAATPRARRGRRRRPSRRPWGLAVAALAVLTGVLLTGALLTAHAPLSTTAPDDAYAQPPAPSETYLRGGTGAEGPGTGTDGGDGRGGQAVATGSGEPAGHPGAPGEAVPGEGAGGTVHEPDGAEGDPSRHTDHDAVTYFRSRWDDRAAGHVKDIRTIGGYLRIYTTLPETAGNSRQALTLCERGLSYLQDTGTAAPVVFVHARFGENGNPVLANILGPGDTTCRVTHPAPG